MADNKITDWEDVEIKDEPEITDWEDVAVEETPKETVIPIPGRAVAKTLGPSKTEEEKRVDMERLEATGRHFLPSATFGLSDIPVGLSGAAGHAYGSIEEGTLPKLEELKETYYEAKEAEQKRRDELMEKHPAESVLGIGVGALAGPSGIATGVKALAKVAPTAAKIATKVLPSLEGSKRATRLKALAKTAKTQDKLDLFTNLKKAQAAAKLKDAIVEGAKASALYGAATGPARLLEGDIKGTVKETLKAGTIGGLAGGGITGAGMAIGGLINKIPGVQNAVDSFIFGTKGYNIEDDQVANAIVKSAKRWNKGFQKKLDDLGISQKEAIQYLDDAGVTINTADDIIAAKSSIEQIKSPTYRKKANEFLDVLNDYLETGAESQKAVTKIQDRLRQKMIKKPIDEAAAKGEKAALKRAIEKKRIPEAIKRREVSADELLPEGKPGTKAMAQEEVIPTGKVDAEGNPIYKTKITATDVTEFQPTEIQQVVDPVTGKEIFSYKDLGTGKIEMVIGGKPVNIDASQLSVKDAKSLQRLVNRYSKLAESEAMPEEATKAATKLATNIGEKIEKVAEGTQLRRINKKISKLLENKEFMKTAPKVTGSRQLLNDLEEQSLAEFIAGTSDSKILSNKALALKRIKSADPELAREFGEELNRLRDLYKLSGSKAFTPDSTNILRAMAGGVGTIVNKVSNATGQAVKALKDSPTVLAKQHTSFLQNSPNYLKQLATKIKDSGKRMHQGYIGPLLEAATAKETTKNAILHGLFQRPAFREMIRDIEETKPTPEETEDLGVPNE